MKITGLTISLCMLVSCASSKEINYTASTPAGPHLRTFLGIPQADSIDFIRWTLSLRDKDYTLAFNYGVGEPNTNGFISGGYKLKVNGTLTRQENIYLLQNDNRVLKLFQVNPDLLHVLDVNSELLAGNSGWSYTINSINPVMTGPETWKEQTVLKDSMVFSGRTPCGVPGVTVPGQECYKLKWSIVLYTDAVTNQPTTFVVPGVPWHKEGGRKGTWKISKGSGGRVSYQLTDTTGNTLYLFPAGDNILLFTDAGGKLLVGDGDFSYTLNRKH